MYFIVVLQEIAQTMQGVDIMLTVFSTQPWMIDFVAQEFFQCLISDNLLDQCKAVVVRIVPWKTDNARLRRSTKPLSADDILTRSGLNAASSIKEKFCKFYFPVFIYITVTVMVYIITASKL